MSPSRQSPTPPRPRFQAGGALSDEAVYVQRAADAELPAALLSGEFCYVLAPRQIGKSSLRVRTRQQLRASGARCVTIDLTTIGSQDSTPEQWYFGMLRVIAGQLDLPDPGAFWEEGARLSPVQRFSIYLQREVLARVPQQVIIFIDEIDAVLALPGGFRDDFFAAVRATYNGRADTPELARLCFCLIGVALPGDLIQDEVRTPFNIGRGIVLEDFTEEEMAGFLPGLRDAGAGEDAAVWLREIYRWTSGHPYMTQKICQALVEDLSLNATPSAVLAPGDVAARVAQVVGQLFLRRGMLEANLADAERRVTRGAAPERTAHLLRLYGILCSGERVPTGAQDPVQLMLLLSGMATQRRDGAGSWLLVRNRIFAEIFDATWVRKVEGRRRLQAPLRRWLEAGRSDDHVLRGQALSEVRAWARAQLDLTLEERDFVAQGVRVELRARLQSALFQTEIWKSLAFFLVLDVLLEHRPEVGQGFRSLVFLAAIGGGLLCDRVLRFRVAVHVGMAVLALSGGALALSLVVPALLYPALLLWIAGDALSRVGFVSLFCSLYPRHHQKGREHACTMYYLALNTGALLAPVLTTLVFYAFHGPGSTATSGTGDQAAVFLLAGVMEVVALFWFRRFFAAAAPPDALPGEVQHEEAVDGDDRYERVRALLLTAVLSVVFWLVFNQCSDVLQGVVGRLGGLKPLFLVFSPLQRNLPSAINALFCVLLTPLFLGALRWLDRVELEPATPAKMWLGTLLCAMSLLLLGDTVASGHALTLGSYGLLTLGELLLVPMQLASVSRLAPPGWTATVLGLCFYLPVTAGLRLSGRLGLLWERWPRGWFFAMVGLILLLTLPQVPRLSAALPRRAPRDWEG